MVRPLSARDFATPAWP